MSEVLVLGVGSPNGDDRAAWEAIAMLERHPAVRAADPAVAIEALDRPGAGLVARLGRARKVVILDAVRSGAEPGRLHRLGGGDLAMDHAGTSSHGFGVAEALHLAGAIGALPAELVVLGIEAGPGDRPGAPLSRAVAQGLPALVAAAVDEFAAAAPGI